MTNTLYVLVGLPGSGKSTWAQKQNQDKVSVISTDKIRLVCFGNEQDQTHNGRVFDIAYCTLRGKGMENENCIFDATNLDRKTRKRIFKELKSYFAKFVAIYFDVPLEICLERNAMRTRVVPSHVIENMAKKLEKPTAQEGFSGVFTISSNLITTKAREE